MYNFAYAYFMVGRYADALRIFDRMPVDAYPPSAYIYRAATLGALGKHEAAKQAVDVALKHNPEPEHRDLGCRPCLQRRPSASG